MANNEPRTLLASAARTATVATSDQSNTEHRGVVVIIDVTAARTRRRSSRRSRARTRSVAAQVVI